MVRLFILETLEDLVEIQKIKTAQYLTGKKEISTPKLRRNGEQEESFW